MQNNMNNPSIPQSNDILACGIPAPAPVAAAEQYENANVWKPTGITGPGTSYKALVRQLPRGLVGLKQNLYPSVLLKTHFLKDPETGVRKTVLCRESLPGQKCPICKKIGGIYKQVLNDPNGGKDAAIKRCKNYWPDEHWYCNVFIRMDQNNSANNGQVRWWKHTPFVEKKLDAPCRANQVPSASAPVQENDIFAQQAAKQQKQEFFIPYDPRNGRDFFVVPEWNSETNRCDYSKCNFADKSSPLAPTDQEMIAILESCPDLNELYANMPDETVAEAAWIEFWSEVNDARRSMGQQAAIGATNPNQFAAGPAGFIPSSQAPFQMPAAQQSFGAPVNHVSGTDYFGGATASKPTTANDPLSVGGQPQQSVANPAQPVNDMLSIGGQQFAQQAQTFAAPAQQSAQQTFAQQPSQQSAQQFSQPATQPMMGAMPAAEDDIELPF